MGSVGLAIALFSGCSALQVPLNPPASSRQDEQLKRKSSGELLYVLSEQDNGLNDYLLVFSWPSVKLLNSFGNLGTLQGICTNANGDVFVTSWLPFEVREYAHGGGIVRTLLQHRGMPKDCAVDPISGDLAVSNWPDRHGEGNVSLYSGARGNPTIYSDPDIALYDFLAYDQYGDLFVHGYANGAHMAKLAELKKGAKAFVNLALAKKISMTAAQIGWADKRLVISTENGHELYNVRVSGAHGKITGTTSLGKCGASYMYIFDGDALVLCGSVLAVFKYPAGAPPIRVSDSLTAFAPLGLVISLGAAAK